MKKLLMLLMLSLFVTNCGHVGTNKYEKIFSSEVLLIDVRSPMEYRYDHLERSVNIPLDKIKEDIKYFAPNKERAIAVYCLSGGRADIAVKELESLGYKNVLNAGKLKTLKEIEEKRNKSNPDQ